ncbi:MAG: DUF389 domain-containing protein [Anaerolineales bacterium]|uniref:DUF389 domain-containing protein n=1 Tax=Candidatus Desulfolinea nitratireducens TaxID=2841698 RepID=A0A8J6TJW2_9CHLR|nr:DUF389 domain-containing protein [Candidatus Desulfolinea nitratireducens]MBL6960142.1 DUF389 domain-containing protein [Anaerolineales bacterium]
MTSSNPRPPQTPSDFSQQTRPTRAQRRRAQRQKRMPRSVEGRSKLLQNLVQRAYPSYEFFIFALLCGAILGLGYLLDSQAFLVFGILMAPLMTPLVGMTLATVSGMSNFFFKTLGAFIIGIIFIFLTGALAGFAARVWMPLTLTQIFVHSRLWWTDLVVLALGSILLAASFVRSEKKPFLPSVIVAYELFLPLNAAAFGLASGLTHIWPQGILVFAAHLAWAMFFGALALFFLGFRPTRASGWIFSALILLLLFGTLGSLLTPGTNPTPSIGDLPTASPVVLMIGTPTDAPVMEIPSSKTPAPTASSTEKPVASATLSLPPSPGITLEPTLTPTSTLTPHPTPLYARITASSGGGAYLRREPGGPVIITLDNNELVQALTAPLVYDGIPWVQVKVVRSEQSFEGWIIQSVLKTATPSPEW